ncbi:phosphonate C-P lyase system protein PhnH [Novispirillum itersonii]|uniref:Alpha-D-ribose 1-methylphosphonate 5-triphosphate synthase subunit PhnH n=1 Tax=Novispirillum itersonii TaxID=189 RepID=A0A7X0DN91_NOVIT|nr:phosphonate C-P lyase system protein PhnH [Novispirillum itersonii]MBB6211755.1 alpha-D-ribose 1-methylphosphonate 5-triphosphate synthase subunit PhnH [Novispirillum itersonii]
MTLAASSLTPGFSDAVHQSQAVFRCALTALSRPGQWATVPHLPPAPAPLSAAAAAMILTLADMDTPLWLDPVLSTPEVTGWVRFHTGAPLVSLPEQAAFAVIADCAALTALDRFSLGTAEAPDLAATLIVQLPPQDATSPARTLTGPGIDGSLSLTVSGLPDAFWADREAFAPLFPQGVDVLLTTPEAVCGLPRTTHATLTAAG